MSDLDSIMSALTRIQASLDLLTDAVNRPKRKYTRKNGIAPPEEGVPTRAAPVVVESTITGDIFTPTETIGDLLSEPEEDAPVISPDEMRGIVREFMTSGDPDARKEFINVIRARFGINAFSDLKPADYFQVALLLRGFSDSE